jgi:hypothetical protein
MIKLRFFKKFKRDIEVFPIDISFTGNRIADNHLKTLSISSINNGIQAKNFAKYILNITALTIIKYFGD